MYKYTLNEVTDFNPYEQLEEMVNDAGMPAVDKATGEVKKVLRIDSLLTWFWKKYPHGSIITEEVKDSSASTSFKAIIYADRNEPVPIATGFSKKYRIEGEEYPAYDTSETLAIRSALRHAGFGPEIYAEMSSKAPSLEAAKTIKSDDAFLEALTPIEETHEKETKEKPEKEVKKQPKKKSEKASKKAEKADNRSSITKAAAATMEDAAKKLKELGIEAEYEDESIDFAPVESEVAEESTPAETEVDEEVIPVEEETEDEPVPAEVEDETESEVTEEEKPVVTGPVFALKEVPPNLGRISQHIGKPMSAFTAKSKEYILNNPELLELLTDETKEALLAIR